MMIMAVLVAVVLAAASAAAPSQPCCFARADAAYTRQPGTKPCALRCLQLRLLLLLRPLWQQPCTAVRGLVPLALLHHTVSRPQLVLQVA